MNVPDIATCVKRGWAKIPQHIKVTFFAAMVIGLLVHIYMLVNKFPNHDDVGQMFDQMRRAHTGRWFLHVPTALTSRVSLPWVKGLAQIFYIALSACLVASCMRIKDEVYCVLLAAVMVCFPTVASTLSYMNNPLFFSLLLACLAAFLADRYRWGFLAGIVCIALSLGIYQAYIGVAAALMVSMLLMGLLRGQPVKDTLFKAARFLLALGLGVVAYIGIVKWTMRGTELTAYMGVSNMGQIPLREMPSLILTAYQGFSGFFIDNARFVHFAAMKYVFAGATVVLLGLLGILAANKNLNWVQRGLAVVMVAILPIAINAVYLLNADDVHMLMVYGLVVIFVLMLALLQMGKGGEHKGWAQMAVQLSSWALSLVVLMSCYNYALVSNQAYLKLQIVYEQGYAYSIELVSQIRAVEDYSTADTVVFVGQPRVGTSAVPEEVDSKLKGMTGVISEIPGSYSYTTYLKRYVGFTQTVVSANKDKVAELGLADLVGEMPVYPNAGSVVKQGDMIVIRFS